MWALTAAFAAGACAGNIAKWNVQVGDEISAGDSIAEIETDKATMDWESQVSRHRNCHSWNAAVGQSILHYVDAHHINIVTIC